MFLKSLSTFLKFRKLILSISVVFLVFIGANNVLAQSESRRGLVVNPAIVEVEAERGNSYQVELTVGNEDDRGDYNINAFLQGFKSGQEEGVPVVDELEPDSAYQSWVAFKQPKFTLKQGEKTKSEVLINIPLDAQPGSHYLALTYALDEENVNQSNDSSVKINPRIAVLLFLNVKGQVQREVNFDYIVADKSVYDPFFDQIKLEYRVSVTGNAYVKPNGNLFIGNDSTNPESTLTINPEQKIVMPNSARTFKVISEPFDTENQAKTNLQSNNNIQQASWPRGWFGPQKIEARILYVNSQSELTQKSSTLEIYYFPWKALLILSPIVLVLGAFIFIRLRRSKNLHKNI